MAVARLYQTHVDMSPSYTNLTFTDNGTNAVVTEGGNIAHAVTLDGGAARLNGSPYIVNGDVVVNASDVLTVSPGTVIRWGAVSRLVVQTGAALIAEGTAAMPVTFTTNAITPTAGSWQYILFDPGSRGLLSHCTVQYAGAGTASAIYLDSSDVQLLLCTIGANLVGDIKVRGGTQPQLTGNRFASESPMAVFNEQPQTPVDARQNWWGHASGPTHPTLNPGGLGAPVSDGVLFEPWLANTTNTPPSAAMVEPAPGAAVTRLPVAFRFVVQDADLMAAGLYTHRARAGRECRTDL